MAVVLPPRFAAGAEKVLKLGHVVDTKHPYHLGAEFFAKRVAELTKGKVEVQVFPSSQLGNDREQLEGLQLGTQDIAVPNSAVAARFIKELDIFNLPFLFRDFQHIYKVLDSKFGEDINQAAQKKGYRVLGWWVGGSRSVYARKPITDLASMKGMKIRTLENPLVLDTWRTLGLIPTPIPMGEVYPALQQGVVDAGEGSVVTYESMKLDEVAPYFANIQYLNTIIQLLISESTFKSLSAESQAALVQAGKESVPVERRLNEDAENKVLDVLRAKKRTIVTPDIKPFMDGVQPVIEKHGKPIGLERIKWVQDHK
jgi:tripartite ATP-independent transporter DctP family solute receptor